MVENVLNLVAKGMSWEQIVAEWHGKVPKEAIAECVELASQALREKVAKEMKTDHPANDTLPLSNRVKGKTIKNLHYIIVLNPNSEKWMSSSHGFYLTRRSRNQKGYTRIKKPHGNS